MKPKVGKHNVIPLSKHPCIETIILYARTTFDLDNMRYIDISFKDWVDFTEGHGWGMHFPLTGYGKEVSYRGMVSAERVVWVVYPELASKILKTVPDARLIVNDLRCPICGEREIKQNGLEPELWVGTDSLRIGFVCGHYLKLPNPAHANDR